MTLHARRRHRRRVLALLTTACAVPVAAQTTTAAAAPTQIVITATRTDTPAFDVPASIDRIDADTVRNGHALVNISESLGGVPGLLARDRQNYAQDVQISVRGFGARSTFGIRGVRLYVDGIPATLPDGQGQISNVELGSVGRIEVLRGPYSALYGNSSGGVIQVFTADASDAPELNIGVGVGSNGLRRTSAQVSGTAGDWGVVASGSRFSTDGSREHSATTRQLGNAKLSWRVDADKRLTLVANAMALPQAQDPLGLTRAQFETRPDGVDPSALSFDTRKTVNQTQAGLLYEQRIDSRHSLRVMAYGGHRGTEQYQSIPVATQASALHPGGVILLGRDYQGADLRWTYRNQLEAGPLTLVAGLAYDALDEQRQGRQNFVGSTVGVEGALRRDENNRVSNADPYLQMSWWPSAQWSVNAGVRRSKVRFRSDDHYINTGNPDDSGRATYGATLPVVGVLFALNDAVHFHVNAGRGFETPTLNELAYRANGSTGLNFALQSSRSDSVEAGVKTRSAAWGTLNAAIFETRSDREIVTQTNLGGRATFQNAGATRRRGFELGWSQSFFQNLRAQLALTALDASYRDAFNTCTATPCATANETVPAGNRIPGVARSSAFVSLSWTPPVGWRAGVEARSLSRVAVNDRNTDTAPAYATASAHVGYALSLGRWDLGGFVRVDNLFNRAYAGSVIVNEGNSRFFEPAPGRTWLASTSATLRF